MRNISQAEQYLLKQIKLGDDQAWSQLINRYQGRLLHFARAKLPQRADCEDIVQDTFISFLKSLNNYRQNCSFETFLFIILRRKIIDSYRRRQSKDIKLIQDIQKTTDYGEPYNEFENLPAPDHTGSWYVRQDEQFHLLQDVLSQALLKLLNNYKRSLNFRDLKIIELIFYCHLPNCEIAKILNINEKTIATIKHRCIIKVRDNIKKTKTPLLNSIDNFENLLSNIWKNQRLSCPKRSTIGAYLLGTLDDQWYSYVDFHLNELCCHYCRANLEDIKRQTEEDKTTSLNVRIMESTIGFLRKP